MSPPYVIVGCGRRKHADARPAADLYLGGYVRAAVAWARTYTDPAHLLILSSKYGLIPGDRVIEPYQVRTFGSTVHPAKFAYETETPTEPHVTLPVIAAQVRDLGLPPGPVLVLASRAYLTALADAAPHLSPVNPFAVEARRRWSDTRYGRQMHLMKAHPGRLPTTQEVPA